MRLTKTQIGTIVALIAYVIWEIIEKRWERTLPPSDPVIRVDLMLIYPILLILILISLFQLIRKLRR